MLVEYKPFEPAFYHTDIADWGMALVLAQAAGPRAKVLVDTGHHYQAQNIEQIVAWLLDLDMLGGFHFNDRRYADDDLTMGSIDPYQVFRIFHEILHFEWETGRRADIAYMIDQSHNLKGKIEAMIQTVTTAMELYAKAALVDHAQLDRAADALRAGGRGDVPEGRVLDRRAAGDSRVGEGARAGRRIRWTRSGRAATWSGSRAERAEKNRVDGARAMPRYAFKLRIKPDAIEEYEREHQRVWPELLAKLKAVGISDYSIFRRGQELVLSLRVDDFEKAWDELDRDPVNQRWQENMSRLFEPVPDKRPGERFAMMQGSFLPGVAIRRSRTPACRQLRVELVFPKGRKSMKIESTRRTFFGAAAGIAGLSAVGVRPAAAVIEPEPWGIKLGVATLLAAHVRSRQSDRDDQGAEGPVHQHQGRAPQADRSAGADRGGREGVHRRGSEDHERRQCRHEGDHRQRHAQAFRVCEARRHADDGLRADSGKRQDGGNAGEGVQHQVRDPQSRAGG